MSVCFFDLESAPLPEDDLIRVMPEFKAPSNYKDKEKIAESVAEQFRNWKDRAALDATTGRVLCIGTLENNVFSVIEGKEDWILQQFWLWLEVRHLAMGHTVAGFSIFHFDLPFLVRRSWINGITVPSIARRSNKWQPWNEDIHDIANDWQCGNREQTISLDTLAKCLGVGAKNGSGKDFASLYVTNKPQAMEYLKNDLELTRKCYNRLNGITLPHIAPITTELDRVEGVMP